MKTILKYMLIAVLALTGSGCSDYLDVVPDRTQEVSLLFNRREATYRALATCYHYMPAFDNTYGVLGATDELLMEYHRLTPGKEVMMGRLNADYPMLSYWSREVDGWGALAPTDIYNAGVMQIPSIYTGMRICNIFLENIRNVPDMTEVEKGRWAAEVKVLKAFYHFLLFSQYGAIPVIRDNIPINATGEMFFVRREPVDDVVNYIVQLCDEALPALPPRIVNATEQGRVDGCIASAIKAKTLLFAASPLFSSNPLYVNIKDHDNVSLFPTGDAAVVAEKWVKAADAMKAAIDLAEANGVKLYTFNTANIPEYDKNNLTDHPERIPYMYNYQYSIVDKWNSELIFGQSRVNTDWHEIQRSINIQDKSVSDNGAAWQWFNPTINSVEFFYTKNGLPMDEDPDYDYDNRYTLTTIPDTYSDVAIPGEQTIKMHLDREPRFYAAIGFDRSRVRAHGKLIDLKTRGGEENGRPSPAETNATCSGYFLRKLVHPDTKGTENAIIRYPWPIIRLVDLYLGYAEALNEAYGEGQQAEVLRLLNAVRGRSGVPTVETAWAKAKNHPNLYQTKDGMRQIIQRERTIENSFEGVRNEDMRRWLRGNDFNQRILVWNSNGTSANDFYTLNELTQLLHVFTTRNYLWPIETTELIRNPNLVQNYGY